MKNAAGLILIFLLFLAAILAACGGATPAPTPTSHSSPTQTVTLSPTVGNSPIPTPSPSPPAGGPVWEDFPPPQLTPVIPIPPPLTGLVLPSEVQVLLLAGVDRDSPYTGRTDAITLVFFQPRLAKASLVSIPPDLFGYIPGFTMQRLSIAYPLGGIEQLESAIAYNLGIRPNSYAIFNVNVFTQLVDDLGGINLFVTDDVRKYCPEIPPGLVILNGEKTLCYLRLRLDDDEFSRNRRQQEVIQTLFLRLVENGNLTRLPELYQKYNSVVNTNISGRELYDELPLLLKLGDQSRIGFFQPGEKELSTWQLSQQPPVQVFLPNRPAMMFMLQQAINFVSVPAPLTDRVATLASELTTSPTPTQTYTVTLTPTATKTPTRTTTSSPTITYTITITPTRTITRTPTITRTRTVTPTRTQTRTQTITPSP